MRRVFLLLHRWLGLSAGLVLAFIGVTGAALVFRPELDARLNPHLLRVDDVAAPRGHVAWQARLQSVQNRFPTRKVSFLFAPRTLDSSDEWWLDKGKVRAYTNPYSGRVLGARSENDDLLTWLFNAHTKLFLGERGELLSGWCGLILCALSISGAVLWRPRVWNWRRALLPNLRTNRAGKVYEWHRAGGFWVALGLFVAGATGAALVWPDAASSLLSVFGSEPKPAKPKSSRGVLLPLDVLIARANAAFPDGQITRVTFPKTGALVIVRKKLRGELHPNGMNNISLDGASGRVLQISDSRRVAPNARAMNLRYPLHIGVWGGNWSLLSRGVAVLVGLCPLWLAWSGFLMWRRKRRRQEQRVTSRANGEKLGQTANL